MMKKLIIFMCLAGFIIGCDDDLLDKVPNDRIAIDNYFSEPSELEAALIGTYSQVISSATMQILFWQMVSADEVTAGIHAQSGIGSGDHRHLTTSNMFGMDATWTTPYKGIVSANLLLDKIDAVDDNLFHGNRKNEIKGEAHFLRGFMYYLLAMNFRDVPVVLQFPTTTDPIANRVEKDPQDSVLAQAMRDFEQAIQLLPEKLEGKDDYQVRGRGSKWAAKGFKARIHMWYGEWEKAFSECQDILNSGQFQLEEKWSDIFYSEYGGTANSKEVIWQSQGESRADYEFMGVYRWYSDANPESPTPQFMVEKELTDMFERPWKDVRLEYSVIRINQTGAQSGYGGRNVKHFHVPSGVVDLGAGTDESRDKEYPFMRLAEILLMKAECIVQSNYVLGAQSDVLDILNRLRERAADPEFVPRHEGDIDASFDPQVGCEGIAPLELADVNLQAVKDEKRRELMFEGVRWIDQLRWAYQEGTIEELKAQVEASDYPEDHRLYSPIIQTEINASRGVLTQNPGY